MPGCRAEKQSVVPAQLYLQQMLNSAMEENRIKDPPETQAQNLGERLEYHSVNALWENNIESMDFIL